MRVLIITWVTLAIDIVLLVGNWILMYRNVQIRKTYERLIASHEAWLERFTRTRGVE